MAIFEHFIECTFEKESDMHRITSDTLLQRHDRGANHATHNDCAGWS